MLSDTARLPLNIPFFAVLSFPCLFSFFSPSFRHHINASLRLSSGHCKLTSLSAAYRRVLCGRSGWVTRRGAKDNISKPFAGRGTMSGNLRRLIIAYNHITITRWFFCRWLHDEFEITLTWFIGHIQWLAEVYAPYHVYYILKSRTSLMTRV